jgi:hypothetical protein
MIALSHIVYKKFIGFRLLQTGKNDTDKTIASRRRHSNNITGYQIERHAHARPLINIKLVKEQQKSRSRIEASVEKPSPLAYITVILNMISDNRKQMNQEGLTKAPILVVLLVAVLFAVANVGIMAGHASMQQQPKTEDSRLLRNVPASNNTSNSTSSIIKKGVTSSENHLSQKSTKSLPASIKTLSVSIKSSQTIVNGRGKLTISAIAYDATTGKKIENALVRLKILFSSNDTSKEIVGRNGEVIYSAEIKPDSKGSSNIAIRTTAQAFAPGYSAKTSLSSSSVITSNGSDSGSSTAFFSGDSGSSKDIINDNASNLAQNILRDVQKRLQNGIDFSLAK